MNPERHPLHARALPEVVWVASAGGVLLDRAADDLARYQVYRYCSIAEALQLLTRREWAFAHPRTWPDKYESHVSERLFAPGGPFAGVSVHVKCLSFEFGSNALWRTYAGTAGVVRLGYPLQDLVAAFAAATLPYPAKLFVARTRYLDERPLRRAVDALAKAPPKSVAREAMRALTLKRSGFAYENELRLCLLGRPRSAPAPVVVLRDLRIERLRSIQLDPYLPSWQAEELRRMFAPLVGKDTEVRQSGVDAAPDSTAP